jgi:hypothetical protein
VPPDSEKRNGEQCREDDPIHYPLAVDVGLGLQNLFKGRHGLSGSLNVLSDFSFSMGCPRLAAIACSLCLAQKPTALT